MNQTRRIAARHISPCNACTSLMSGTAAATNRANVLQYSGMRGIVVYLDGRLRAGAGVTARHRAAMACLPPVDMCLPDCRGIAVFCCSRGGPFPAGYMGYDASGS